MVGKQHVWVLDTVEAPYGPCRDELAKADVALAVFTTADAMLAAAKSPQVRLPRLLIVEAGLVDALLSGPPQSAPRAALLRHAPFLLVGDQSVPSAAKSRAAGFVPKPVSPAELIARVSACLAPAARHEPGDVTFNIGALTVAHGGHAPTTLTPREFQILSLLYRANDHVATRAELFAEIWSGVKVCNKVLDVHVSKLRKKLTGVGIGINFIRPAGYRLELMVGQSPLGEAAPGDRHDGEPLVAAPAFGHGGPGA